MYFLVQSSSLGRPLSTWYVEIEWNNKGNLWLLSALAWWYDFVVLYTRHYQAVIYKIYMSTQAVPICFLGHHRHPPALRWPFRTRLLLALAIVDELPEAALEQVGQRFSVTMIHQDSIKTPIKTSRNDIIYVICGPLWKWWSHVIHWFSYWWIIRLSFSLPSSSSSHGAIFMIFQDILCTVYPIFRQWQDAMPGPSLPGARVVAPQRAMCSSGARWAEGHGSKGGPERCWRFGEKLNVEIDML